MGLKQWLFGMEDDNEEEEDIISPMIDQRRKDKFSEPLIYNEEKKEEVEEKKEEVVVKKVEPKPKKVVKKPVQQPRREESTYRMSQIISPMSGLQNPTNENGDPIPQPKKKKRFKKSNDLNPIISPFYGPEEEEIEEEPVVEEVKETKKVKRKVKHKKVVKKPVVEEEPVQTIDKEQVIDSVEERLRNIASLTEETQDDLKIIEERTGKFKLDFNQKESTLIDEIDDNMSLDELMNLYEKKFKE